MYGSFESSLFFEKYGIKLKEKWNSKGSISAEASTANQITKGLTNYVKAGYDVKSEYVVNIPVFFTNQEDQY